MKHELSHPCKDCPFRTDVHPYLREGRVREISKGILRGDSFWCHRTTEYSDETDDMAGTVNSKECAGEAIYTAHQGVSAQWRQIAERLWPDNVTPLDMDAPVARDLDELLGIHADD